MPFDEEGVDREAGGSRRRGREEKIGKRRAAGGGGGEHHNHNPCQSLHPFCDFQNGKCALTPFGGQPGQVN